MARKTHKKDTIKYIIPKSQLKQVEEKILHSNTKEKRLQFHLTEFDRITQVYKMDSSSGEICEVTCVSYEIEVQGIWHTVLYFDNYHDKLLHRHLYVSLEKHTDVIDRNGLPKNKSPKKLLTWAMKYLRNNYFDCRRGYIKRSKKYLQNNKIKDIYY